MPINIIFGRLYIRNRSEKTANCHDNAINKEYRISALNYCKSIYNRDTVKLAM